jgi:hypothetical protein
MQQQRSLLPHSSARRLPLPLHLTISTVTTTFHPSIFHHPHHNNYLRNTVDSLLFLTTIPSASSTPAATSYAFTSLLQAHFSAAPQSLLRAVTSGRRAYPCIHQATASNWQLSPIRQTQAPPTKWLQSPISWACQSSCKRRYSNTYVPQSRALS